MRLAEIFVGSMEDGDQGERFAGLPEAQIARLREVFTRIERGCPFTPGELVTIRKDAPINGVGKPHLIIEIDSDAGLHNGNVGTWVYATRHDVIILAVNGDDITPLAVPHWMLERYAEGHRSGAPVAAGYPTALARDVDPDGVFERAYAEAAGTIVPEEPVRGADLEAMNVDIETERVKGEADA